MLQSEENKVFKGVCVLSLAFMPSFEVSAAELSSYTLAERVDVLESPVAIEWRGVTLYEYLQGIEMISDDGEGINFYAPVGELASALDLTIAKSGSDLITGWTGDPDNSWSISLDSASNKDESFPVEKSDVVSWNGELFASVDTLKKAFGFEIELNEAERIITVGSGADIPMLMAYKRSENRKLLLWNKANEKVEKAENTLTPFYVKPYAIASIPTLDGSISVSHSNAKNATSIGYYVATTSQVLYMDSRISFSGRIMDNADIKPSFSLNSINLSRDITTNQNETLRVSLGDVSFGGPSSPASTVGSGRGVSVNKRYKGQSTSMKTESEFLYIGNGTPGNDIEVYRNENNLIYSSVIPDTGIYQIPKQNLFAGMNIFHIREYDAGGLVNEVVIKRSISRSQVEAGKSSWGIALLQPNRNMRDILTKDSKNKSKDERAGVSFVYSLGVTDNFPNTVGYSYIPTSNNKKQSYTQVFGNTFTISAGSGSLGANVNTYLSGSSNALTTSFNYSTPLGENISLSAGRTNYVNDDARKLFKRKNSSDFSVSFSFPDFNSSSISQRVSIDKNLKDNHRVGLSTFGGIKLGMLSLSSSFTANLPQGNTNDAAYRGSVSSSVSPKGILASAQMSYTKDPNKYWEVNDYRVRLSLLEIKKKWGVNTRLIYNPNPDVLGTSLGFSKNFRELRFTSSVQVKTDRSYSLGFSLGTSLSYIPNKGFVLSGGSAPTKIIIPEYFIDSNDNGVMDDNEKPVQGIDALISGTSFASDQASGADGRGFLIRDIKTDQPFTVQVDRTSMRDPFLISREKGYSVNSPAPNGEELVIPIPMVRVSDVEIFVFEERGIDENPVSRMIFELYRKGEKIKRMRSMSGGELYFENLLPGEYILKAAEKQFGSAAGYTVEDDIDFTVSGEEIQIKKIRVQVDRKSE